MFGLLLCAWLGAASVDAGAGPPVLPPLPGEREDAAPDDEIEKPSPPPKTAPPPRAPSGPAKPEGPPAPEPATEPSGATPPGDSTWSIPDTAEPPQPEGADAPPQEDPAQRGVDASESRDKLTAPRIGDEGGSPDGMEGPRWQIPPPRKPPYNGTGLFIGAGVTFVLALSEQIAAHILVKRRCIDPIADGEYDTSGDVGDVVAGCAPGVLPALALRLNSDLALLATIGLAAGGAATRGTSDAYDDVFSGKPARKLAGLRAGGISLIGAGLLTWFGTGAGGWAWLGGCNSGRCANRARLFTFLTRDTSAIMVASGAGMLTFAEIYRRRHESFTRDRAFSIGPSVSGSNLGIVASGRF